MIKSLFKHLITAWLLVLIISFFTAPDITISDRAIGVLALGGIAGFGAFFSHGKAENKERSKDARISESKHDSVYAFSGPTGTQVAYRIENNRIYKGALNSQAVYRIESDKIYPVLDNKFAYRIEKNKIYSGLNAHAILRIEGDKVYRGELGREIVYRLKSKPY